MVVCVAFTALRSLDPEQPRLIELAAVAPLGIPFACIAIAAAATLWIIRADVGVRASRWVVAAGVVLLGLHLAWIAPFYTGSSPTTASGPEIVVLAQNFEYGNAPALAEVTADSGADLVVLSDLPPNQLEALRRTDLLDRYPYQVGLGRDGPEGTVVLSKHRLFGEALISDGGDSRLVRVTLPGAKALDLVAIHTTPPYQRDAWRHDYARVHEFLVREYGSGTKAPVLVVGDFNATQGNAPFRRILDLGFQDAADRANGGYQPTWPADGSRQLLGVPLPPLLPIDHALVSQALVVASQGTVQVLGSDHFGIVVHLSQN